MNRCMIPKTHPLNKVAQQPQQPHPLNKVAPQTSQPLLPLLDNVCRRTLSLSQALSLCPLYISPEKCTKQAERTKCKRTVQWAGAWQVPSRR